MLAGLPLAGKTTWIRENEELLPKNFEYISADVLKESHKEYDPNKAELLHEWSVKAAKTELQGCSTKGYNIVFDTGSINNNYTINILKELRDKNYNIVIVHVKTPYKICLERNKLRTRKVPENNITDKALKEISQIYKIAEYADRLITIDYFTNAHIFVDMDGVIAAQSALPIIDGEIDFVNGEIHRWQEPVELVINKLKALEARGTQLYILSATPNSFSSEEKHEWLDNHFNISRNKRFFVNQGKHKAEMLDNLRRRMKMEKRDVTLIEDTHSTIRDVVDRGMNGIHISEFLTTKFK